MGTGSVNTTNQQAIKALRQRQAEIRKEDAEINAKIQELCDHEWRWQPVAGEGMYCPWCGALNFDVND